MILQTTRTTTAVDRHERRHRREVQRRVEELAGKVEELRNTREEDRCRCHDNGEPRPRFTVPLLDLEEFGTRVV